jgi:UDP-N-acetylmuramoylalanine--D-glutamate ligase
MSVARWLSREGAGVTISDVRPEADLDPDLLRESLGFGVGMETGGHNKKTFLKSDMIILSPGVPLDIEPLEAARAAGIPIIGEMELAVRLIDIPILAVTGTNGKSTTTTLLGSMMKRAGLKFFLGGNIGTPLMDYAAGVWKADYAVVEVSSFQLDTMERFSPWIALLLNISPDHLDRYPNYQAYVQSKLKIFQNQGPGTYAILNDDDERVSQSQPPKAVSVLRYGLKKRPNLQAFIEDKKLWASLPGRQAHSFDYEEFKLPGRHNLENLMAAVLAALALQIAPHIIQKTIKHFQGLPDRLEPVGTIGGVHFYDDSKATNVDAAVRSIISFDRPVILIAGGRHKGADYSPLVKAARERVREAVFLGEARRLLANAFEGVLPFTLVGDMREAVTQAFSSAKADDVVLLAPACSSFDMYSDYAHRGRIFKEEVKRLDNGHQETT